MPDYPSRSPAGTHPPRDHPSLVVCKAKRLVGDVQVRCLWYLFHDGQGGTYCQREREHVDPTADPTEEQP